MAVVAMGISRWILPRFMGSLEESMELYLLCAICVMMFMLKLTATLGLSMELGSFTAGLMISVHPKHTHPTLTITESVRDLFACVFFVTMGLHI
mmetsp:Transcript_29604/g.50280  ORF Transcript_29604/g.50280 Transcript_29604/m.50280 type:complete len:94 (-) Transcript_29604:3-284(-)